MHSKIYLGPRDLPEKNLDSLVRRLRIRGIELVLHPNKFGYAYASSAMKPSQIMKAYIQELNKCESDESK